MLRTPGIANWDMSLYKNIPVHQNMALNFRVEAFNLFNRLQFGVPNGQLGTSTLGWITAQANSPRILQIAGRFFLLTLLSEGLQLLKAAIGGARLILDYVENWFGITCAQLPW